MNEQKFQDILASIEEAKQQIKKATAELQKNEKATLFSAFKSVLEEHPEIEAFQWTGSVPSFNDGDPCVFSRHEVTAKPSALQGEFNFEAEDAAYSEKGFYDSWSIEYAVEEKKIAKEDADKFCKGIKEMDRILNSLGDDIVESIFGDGHKVTVSREGLEVEEYEGDY